MAERLSTIDWGWVSVCLRCRGVWEGMQVWECNQQDFPIVEPVHCIVSAGGALLLCGVYQCCDMVCA